MRNLIDYADKYLEQANWKDMALLKVCLCSMGIIMGASVGEKAKKPVKLGAKILFVATCVPLAMKSVNVLLDDSQAEDDY
ncbi:MAG: hypothetical protein ACK5MV_00725 [Aminipila sp.]